MQKSNLKNQNCSSKIKSFKFLIVILIFAFYIFNFTFVSVASTYQPLQPLPGIEGSSGGSLSSYLTWFFRFALAAAAFLAVLQIVIAGVQMIAGGASESARSDAKKRISDALWGLALALAAWLILYTINPDLLSMKLIIP